MKRSFISAAVALVSMLACSASDDAAKQPLGAAAASPDAAPAGAGGPVLSQAAKDALDAGNFAYRAKQYALAIEKYREAAVAAPSHAAPWFGVYMAASELKNTALADSAMAQVKQLSADPAALGAHAEAAAAPSATGGALPPGHPSTQTPLPEGHPTVKPQLPEGHPAPVKKP